MGHELHHQGNVLSCGAAAQHPHQVRVGGVELFHQVDLSQKSLSLLLLGPLWDKSSMSPLQQVTGTCTLFSLSSYTVTTLYYGYP